MNRRVCRPKHLRHSRVPKLRNVSLPLPLLAFVLAPIFTRPKCGIVFRILFVREHLAKTWIRKTLDKRSTFFLSLTFYSTRQFISSSEWRRQSSSKQMAPILTARFLGGWGVFLQDQGATSKFAHLEKFSLNFSISL